MGNDPLRLSGFAHRPSAVLICLPRLYEVKLIDISAHAALVETKGRIEINAGDRIRLRVLTERGNHAFEVEALVAHYSELSVGLEIEAIDAHARCSLQRLIGMNPGALDPAARTLNDLIEANSCASLASLTAWARDGCRSTCAAAIANAIAVD